VTNIIHLAGLQVPFCKADPPAGARVNVLGTINILELIREFSEQINGFAYASSIAVMGAPKDYPVTPVAENVVLNPGTLYGVYKQANEASAEIYWNDWNIASVGLRPFIVYGVGRDQGLTSDIAKAILAAAADRAYKINFGGVVALQYAEDVAKMFVEAARSLYQGAAACNLRNDVISVEDFVQILSEEVPGSRITCLQNQPLPFPADLDDQLLRSILGSVPHTPLRQAIRKTAAQFKKLLSQGLVDLKQLE
jgi:nucleoside-diphosphate-sugar epimerase